MTARNPQSKGQTNNTYTCSLTKKVNTIAENSKPAWVKLSNVYYISSDSYLISLKEVNSILCTKDTSKRKISTQISSSVLTVQK